MKDLSFKIKERVELSKADMEFKEYYDEVVKEKMDVSSFEGGKFRRLILRY